MQNQHQNSPPAGKINFQRLKPFKLGEELCKIGTKENEIEYPQCSKCLIDIILGHETILSPCGHLFHSGCLINWLNLHSDCPLCKYEFPIDDPNYESNRQEQSLKRETALEKLKIKSLDIPSLSGQNSQVNTESNKEENNMNEKLRGIKENKAASKIQKNWNEHKNQKANKEKEEKKIRRKLVETALKALETEVTEQTVFPVK